MIKSVNIDGSNIDDVITATVYDATGKTTLKVTSWNYIGHLLLSFK